jgi:hypothetical protein
MTNDQHDEGEWPTVPRVPAWIKPILQGEAAKRDEAKQQYEDVGRHAAEAINRYLASLGIEPLRPAEWTQDGLRYAVLLEPDHCGVDDWGVQAGWNGEVCLYAVRPDGVERYFGPLNSVQDAADARRGPCAVKPEPPDHERIAEDELCSAALFNPGEEDPFEVAFLAGIRGLGHAVLALDETVSRIGARQALRQAAALGEIPLDRVRLTPQEKTLLRDLFPPTAADDAPADDGS